MAKKLYVGNLPYSVSDSDPRAMFEPFGMVQSAQVIVDRDTGRSKGFGFVEMSNDQEGQAAIEGMHDQEINGRKLTVNEARPKRGSRTARRRTRRLRRRWRRLRRWWPRRTVLILIAACGVAVVCHAASGSVNFHFSTCATAPNGAASANAVPRT